MSENTVNYTHRQPLFETPEEALRSIVEMSEQFEAKVNAIDDIDKQLAEVHRCFWRMVGGIEAHKFMVFGEETE